MSDNLNSAVTDASVPAVCVSGLYSSWTLAVHGVFGPLSGRIVQDTLGFQLTVHRSDSARLPAFTPFLRIPRPSRDRGPSRRNRARSPSCLSHSRAAAAT